MVDTKHTRPIKKA